MDSAGLLIKNKKYYRLAVIASSKQSLIYPKTNVFCFTQHYLILIIF